MAHIDECVPGLHASILRSGVARVIGKTGMIIEVSRIKRSEADPLVDLVTVDIPRHGPVVVSPGDIAIVAA